MCEPEVLFRIYVFSVFEIEFVIVSRISDKMCYNRKNNSGVI